MWWCAVATVAFVAGCGRLGFEDARRDATSPVTDADPCASPSGLIGAWPMDTQDLQGSTLIDRSGNGRDGTLIGSTLPILSPGRVGQALDFSATSIAYVDVPTLPLDASPSTATTVSLWFFEGNANADEGVVCLPTGPTTAPPRYCLWLTNRIGPASLCINGGEGECWGITDPGLIGRWVHVVVIYANGRTDGGRLYIDGVPATMSCRFGVCDRVRVAQPPFEIGNRDSGYAWRGLIDDVQVFARALDATEIAQLHACTP